jgi:uncharacterized protein
MILPYRNRLTQSANSPLYTAAIDALPPSLVGMTGTVRSLHLAPIKAAGMLNLTEARLTTQGLATSDGFVRDRGAMLMFHSPGRAGPFGYQWERLSQREVPGLALVRVTYDPLRHELTYTAPGMPRLHVKDSDLYANASCGDLVRMFPGDPELCAVVRVPNGHMSTWFQSFLKGKSDRHPSDRISVGIMTKFLRRPVPAHHLPPGESAQTLYTDGDQLLVANHATLTWLNAGLQTERAGFRTIEMAAFRPEIVLDGLPACAEDLIEEVTFTLGGQDRRIVLTCHCVRCPVTQVNQATGTRQDNQPVSWLIKNRPHRQDAPGKPTFGWNAYTPADSMGPIQAGIEFRVTKERQ